MIKNIVIAASVLFTVSIYSLSETDIDGNSFSFSVFQGKKLLIVNTATSSPFVNQYAGLEQLYQQYKDSLVIIAFPSNSFGNEPRSNADIKSFVDSTYDVHFLLGSKVNVKGAQQSVIYQWLTDQNQNDMMNSEVHGDFQKYLIDRNGRLIGVFASSVAPMDSLIQNAIVEN